MIFVIQILSVTLLVISINERKDTERPPLECKSRGLRANIRNSFVSLLVAIKCRRVKISLGFPVSASLKKTAVGFILFAVICGLHKNQSTCTRKAIIVIFVDAAVVVFIIIMQFEQRRRRRLRECRKKNIYLLVKKNKGFARRAHTFYLLVNLLALLALTTT